VMQGAVHAAVPGIDADCGGALSCATCMVYVPPEWASRPRATTKMACCNSRRT
jgi:2Fe-2S ferredoxin